MIWDEDCRYSIYSCLRLGDFPVTRSPTEDVAG